jgi:hypothetical protein
MKAEKREPRGELTGLEKVIQPRYLNNPRMVIRDREGNLLMADERAIDFVRIVRESSTLMGLGKRVRVMTDGMRRQAASYILPADLLRLSRENPKTADGCETPLGKVIADHGLYLKLKPGLTEIGANDRQDVVLYLDPAKAGDATSGPVTNSANTIIAGRAKRLVTRVSREEHEKDVREARAWLKAMEIANGNKTLVSRYSCAGIQYEHRGNVPYLYRTTQLNFFSPKDPEMAKIGGEVREKFQRIGRPVSSVQVISLTNLPADDAAHKNFLSRLRKKKTSAAKLGLPERLRDSQLFDPQSKGISSSNFVFFCPLSELGEKITIITANTDYHGEVKSRGVLSPLMAIMSLIGVISAHAGAAVLNSRGTATTFTGPTGTGKTTACTFWAEKNEKFRREELQRRYELELTRGELGRALERAAAKRRAAGIMESTGILCQEDWVEIVPTDGNRWVFWPTERSLYARTGGFPGLNFVLLENEPLLENAAVDLGAAGSWEKLGRVTHDYFPERIFYDPEWNHMCYNRTPRQITANVFLERDPSLDFCVKRVREDEAVEWLLKGRTPSGAFEPLYNAYPDFSGLLMSYGIVGDKLIEAYREAQRGNADCLAPGSPEIGRAIFDKLDVQVKLWLKHCSEVPAYIVNGAPGLEITQDINWYLSEHPDFIAPGHKMSTEEFKRLMQERYGVTYGEKGRWNHIKR